MRKTVVAAALVVPLALSACQTTTVDQAVQQSLPQICDAAEAAYAGISIYIAAGELSPANVARVENARDFFETVCVNPEQQTAATVLVSAATAYAVMTTVLANADD